MSKPCGCGIPPVPGFPEAGLEIIKKEPPVQFHKKVFPASLGDETSYPPNTLDYKNIILEYEASGNVYIYSSDGIPTKINGVDASEFLQKLEALGTQISEETVNREEADKAMQNQIDANSGAIAAQTASITSIIDDLQSEVQLDTTITSDASTVSVNKRKGQIGQAGTATAMPLPVASSTSAGVMNAAIYNSVQQNAQTVNVLLNGAVALEGLPASPTQTELTNAWKAAVKQTTLINRASIYDVTNSKVWTYYTNAAEWYSQQSDEASVNVSIATNETAGIVKGSEANGQIAVEADGTMSLNGYDTLNSDVNNLSEKVDGIVVPQVPEYIAGQKGSNQAFEFHRSTTAVNLIASLYKSDTGSRYSSVTPLPFANSTQPGVMSAADKSKLDSLLTIKALDDTLSLSEDGTLSVVGGGSDVNLLTEYTASPAADDVYSAGYVNSRLDTVATLPLHLGRNSLGASYSIAIGAESKALESQSVALGYAARVTREKEVSIGYGSTTRYLANVTAGELPTDAVNLQQMEDYVAEQTTVQVLDELASSPDVNEVYSAELLNNQLFNTHRVVIGNTVSASGSKGIGIGWNVSAGPQSIAMGNGAKAVGTQSIAIGTSAEVTDASANQVAVGYDATCNNGESVALGHGSVTSRTYEVSVGSGTTSAFTRIIANVTAGVLDTDAVNVAQLNAALDRIQALEAEVAALKG